jgi:hypothetical protein
MPNTHEQPCLHHDLINSAHTHRALNA